MAEVYISDKQPLPDTTLQLDSFKPPWLLSRTLFAAGSLVTEDIANSVRNDILINDSIAQRNLDVIVLRRSDYIHHVWDHGLRRLPHGLPVPFQTPDTYHPIYLSASVDYDRIRSKMSDIRTREKMGLSRPMSLPEGMRFIDCRSQSIRVIAVGTSRIRYAALSYVWGRPQAQDKVNVPHTTSATIPATIRDAMTVARELGIRFLWVDKYCIDESSKHTMISQMGKIYKSALITIVAVAGDNPDHGLPGLSRMRHLEYHEGTIMVPNPKDEIKASRWSTRGWTFQEGELSPINLFFTPTQWLLKDQAMVDMWTTEAKYTYPLEAPTFNTKKGDVYILDAVNQYASRDLTYTSDSLNAFLGVLEDWQSASLSHLSGIPFGVHYPWRESTLGFIESFEETSVLGLFLHGIFWGCRQVDLIRVPTPPSWTWAGWRGFTKYDRPYGMFTLEQSLRTYKRNDAADVDVQVHLDAPYSLRECSRFMPKLNEENKKGNLVNTIQITGWSIELDYSQVSKFEAQWDSIDFLNQHQNHRLAMLVLSWPLLGNTKYGVRPRLLVLGKCPDTEGVHYRLGRLIWHISGGLDPQDVAIEGQYFERRSLTLK